MDKNDLIRNINNVLNKDSYSNIQKIEMCKQYLGSVDDESAD